MITKRGTNQYKAKKHLTVLESVLIISLIVSGLVIYGQYERWSFIKNAISPLAEPVFAAETPTTPTPEPLPEWVQDLQLIVKEFSPFGKDEVAKAVDVAKNESGWNRKAQNWNCWYSQDGTVKSQKTEPTDKSTSCSEQDKPMAWSVDCGLLQINVSGKSCPSELFDPKKNIAKAVEMYKRRSWQPWVAAKKLGLVK